MSSRRLKQTIKKTHEKNSKQIKKKKKHTPLFNAEMGVDGSVSSGPRQVFILAIQNVHSRPYISVLFSKPEINKKQLQANRKEKKIVSNIYVTSILTIKTFFLAQDLDPYYSTGIGDPADCRSPHIAK